MPERPNAWTRPSIKGPISIVEHLDLMDRFLCFHLLYNWQCVWGGWNVAWSWPTPNPLGGEGPRVLQEVCSARTVRFWEKFMKKRCRVPLINWDWLGQYTSKTSSSGLAAHPSTRGRSAAMVLGLIGPKLGRSATPMGTCPQKIFWVPNPGLAAVRNGALTGEQP